MLTSKRVLIATLCGILFGLICMSFAVSNPNSSEPVTAIVIWSIIISRTLMGFTIGISALRMRWPVHGLFIGFIASIPMAIATIDRPAIAAGSIVMGMIYGLLTELITTKLFKAKSAFVVVS